MRSRGMGYVYQPKWRDQRTGERKTADTWWISYSTHGKRHRENAHSTKEADAAKLLKLRLGQAAIGMPVGPQVERTTLGDILKMVEVDYAANGRRSLGPGKTRRAHLKEFLRSSYEGARHYGGPDNCLSSGEVGTRREICPPSITNWRCYDGHSGSGVAREKSRRGPRSRCCMSRIRARGSLNPSSIARCSSTFPNTFDLSPRSPT